MARLNEIYRKDVVPKLTEKFRYTNPMQVPKLEKVIIKNSKDGTTNEMPIDGVFVAIGHVPSTKIFSGKVDLDEKGYIKKMPNDKYQMSTNVDGVFVAGDVHDYHYRQAITAAGFGCQAGMEALKFLDKPTPNW